MKKKYTLFILLTITGTLFLLPNYYHNAWNAVDQEYYEEWQTRYDRFVIARLVKTRQDGFFSAGGLLGMGDTDKIGFATRLNRHQFNTFLNNGKFQIYTTYKSNPGFQGILYGSLDKLPGLTGAQKINIFRGFTSITSATFFGLMFAIILTEFGLLAGALMLLFSAFSIWIVLPAGSIFWNLWAFFLPFVTSIYVFTDSARSGIYKTNKILALLFITTLIRILLSGFDVITAGLIMTTTPVIFFASLARWDFKVFLKRFTQVGIAISLATLTGLSIMFTQITINDGGMTSAIEYVESRFGHHLAGNKSYFLKENIEATHISTTEIVGKYLLVPALELPVPGPDIQVLHWHIILIFFVFTVLFFAVHKFKKRTTYSPKGIALIITTWYSISAPLSWILLFKPHSIIHPHVNSMAWQMPFTLLGFALCGFVITDFFKKENRPA